MSPNEISGKRSRITELLAYCVITGADADVCGVYSRLEYAETAKEALQAQGKLAWVEPHLVDAPMEWLPIWIQALRIWKSPEAASEFLHREHPLLGGRRPVEVLEDGEGGRSRVRDLLGGLEAGTGV